MSFLSRAASLAGLDLKAVGPRNLQRAAERAMARLGTDREAYLERLARAPRERGLLAGQAVVQETWLFRDPAAFEDLARFATGLDKPFRILCAPCATGEEAASAVAALCRAGFSPTDFSVDAVDANPAALEAARTGRFGPESLRSPLPDCPGLRCEGGLAVLDEALLARIRFLEADLLGEGCLAGEPPYQAVLCRHLLIYLNPPARQRLADTIKRLLAPGGALIASPAEAAAFARLGIEPLPSGGRAPMPPIGWKSPGAGVRPGGPGDGPTVASFHAGRGDGARQARPSAGPSGPDVLPTPDASMERGAPLDRAESLADAGNLDQALELVDQDLRVNAPTARHYHIRGAALLALGRDEEAEQALRRALYLDPGHAQALAHLGLLAKAKGRDGEAALLAGRARRAGEAR